MGCLPRRGCGGGSRHRPWLPGARTPRHSAAWPSLRGTSTSIGRGPTRASRPEPWRPSALKRKSGAAWPSRRGRSTSPGKRRRPAQRAGCRQGCWRRSQARRRAAFSSRSGRGRRTPPAAGKLRLRSSWSPGWRHRSSRLRRGRPRPWRAGRRWRRRSRSSGRGSGPLRPGTCSLAPSSWTRAAKASSTWSSRSGPRWYCKSSMLSTLSMLSRG
mmetsp:Transcript_137411/g.383250  ORF Transcript_137411/g.383250 Transcript_137411/m.383250 type:complete len:214 (-) Transcript_137411:70-711(-)